MASPIRVGVIGCGNFMRRQHLQTIARSENLRLEHLADCDAAALAEVADRYGPAKSTLDWKEVVADDDVDVVVIGVIPSLHPTLAAAAIERGKPVYVEKPLSENLEDGLRLHRLAAGREVPVAVGFNRRFAPASGLLAGALAGRKGPTTLFYRIVDDERARPPHQAWKQADRLVLEVVHIFDLLAFLLGRDPARIRATEARFNDTLIDVGFADGSQACILSSSHGSVGQPKEHLEAILDGGSIEMDDFVEVRTHGLADLPERTCLAGRPYDDCDNSHVTDFARRGLPAYLDLRRRYVKALAGSGMLGGAADASSWRRFQHLLGRPPPPQINYCPDKGWAQALETFCACAAAGEAAPNAGPLEANRALACALAARRSIETGSAVDLDSTWWRR